MLRRRSPDDAARGEGEATTPRAHDEPHPDDVEFDNPHDPPLSL
jgi:hypothetical protein